ncbi:NAD-dependent epimerase/dehydratase family protein [Flavobacterium sp. M31R6]|jgi:nucleoside-diphosphate-sugar epimerase|uniref:NAD-dependent epimerase/dehydratase family protein n=1 Tax=Flavobacterium sp. M31R6 TaxID=2739062 RepID=UPI001569AD75|nr:NAD-dependent epimerase/dehydratase family protein [Flavobacterium sp. M31R6]QKJ62078.1 SDR family NAD(P)-dependent oxidoreductase [Flavobacterium sp. M31R6]
MRQISILGCGWLGLPLAKALLTNGFSVKGSTTSEGKLSTLKSLGINPFLIALDSKNITGAIEDFLNGSETLIIDIPPQLRGKNLETSASNEKVFVEKIKTLIPYIEKSTIKNVLFISSTSVYGEVNGMISEETVPKPNTESGKQLLEAESLFQNNNNFKSTILRFGGLIGEDRNPIKSLAGKINLENPKTPINFIHQEDCIGIILKIIATDFWNEIYNGVSPFHPTRETYYTQKATELALPLPQFDHSKPSIGKLILSDKVETDLGYSFIKTNL